MRKIFVFLFAIFFITTPALLTYHGSTSFIPMSVAKLSMEKTVVESMKKKPSIHALQQAVKGFERQQQGTLSTFLPNLTLSEKIYNSKNASLIKSSFSIVASQTILNLSQMDYYKLHGSKVSSAKHQKELHIDDIQLATETVYLNSWLLQQKLPLILMLHKTSVATFSKAKHQHKLNLTNKNDYLKSYATHSENLATVDSYRDDISNSEKELEYYSGLKMRLLPTKKSAADLTKLEWDPHKKITALSLDFYYKKGLANRKDLKVQQDEINTEAYTSQYYLKQYVPSVSLFGSISKNTLRQGSSTFSKEAGLQVSWNFFDGAANYFNKSAADARKMKAILNKSDLVSKVKLEIQQAYSALQIELKKLDAENASYRQAKNESILRRQEFEIGIISQVDFHTAEYTYELGRFSWMNQVATAALKERSLMHKCGYFS